MSRPCAVATRPGLSLIPMLASADDPMLASADDAMQSRPVSPRSARSEVSWSQSRSQEHRPPDVIAGPTDEPLWL
jgi:hypothetical protein